MDTGSPRGTQSVARAALLMRLVTAQGERGGARMTYLVAESGLTRPTAHRLLTALKAEALVDQDPVTGRWFPGPELFLMGTVAAERYDVAERSRDIVHALALETEESAFFSMRRGDETVCLVHEDGAFPIRSHVLSEGVRFPLGVASAGLVILALLPAAESDAYLARTGDSLAGRWGQAHGSAPLRTRIAETRDRGYSVNPGLIVEGSWGMGAAVLSKSGRPDWALSITGVEFRFDAARRAELGRALLAHAHELSRRMR
ncbi:putative IclR-family regulatory protein [Microbacterium faecale]|uniref:IclR-family regulatory protein n=1 Tax=Microbacterium faecale TaxID=1804630 RepID=A0A916Y606_9MICO|nr:IclR family transcriptional regulator [Microbacterium faecale]GGD32762.1 putative IclR-family regulatory protein [Microbacterium faecale]